MNARTNSSADGGRGVWGGTGAVWGPEPAGPCHLIEDAFVGKFGRLVGVAKKDDTYAKKGLVKSTFEAAAWVAIKSNGTGMWGAYNATAEVFQSSVNYFTGERN